VGYSERLSLLFTKEIGRNITNDSGFYIGAPIGDSLARAKRAYLRTTAPGSFSAFDEKVLLEWTFYGLPFIRVRVPVPSQPAYGSSFDPPPQPIIGALRGSPSFTRIVTFTNRFEPDPPAAEQVPQVYSIVEDSFRPGETTLVTSESQMAIGRPVLPSLSYDITLLPSEPGAPPPAPKGVRLLRATALPDLSNYNPHVTTPVTDNVYPQQQNDPAMEIQGAWLPYEPYSTQRTENLSATEVVTRDILIANPAQFRASNSETGELRRFGQMVFEISYLDPAHAPAALKTDDIPPLISDIRISLGTAALQAIGPASLSAQISARVSDSSGSGLDTNAVTATYSTDGEHWGHVVLNPMPNSEEFFNTTVSGLTDGRKLFVIIEARDKAGNTTTDTSKGNLSALTVLYLPIVRR
jgi:hypothetical protein